MPTPAMRILLFSLLAFTLIQSAWAEHDLAPLRKALAQQAKYRSVSVKIRQTKKIPALTAPIKNTGQLWLKPGKAFRWQIGDPKATTAIYNGKDVYLLDEQKKSAVAYPSDHRKVKPLLLMLGIGEGASVEKMTQTFSVTGVTRHQEHYIVAFRPQSGKLKRVIKTLVLQINLKTSFMERIEWTQKDGSVITTEFYPPKINVTLPDGIFSFQKTDYQWK